MAHAIRRDPNTQARSHGTLVGGAIRHLASYCTADGRRVTRSAQVIWLTLLGLRPPPTVPGRATWTHRWVTVAVIAERAGCSPRTAQRALRALQSAELLLVRTTTGRATRYCPTAPWERQECQGGGDSAVAHSYLHSDSSTKNLRSLPRTAPTERTRERGRDTSSANEAAPAPARHREREAGGRSGVVVDLEIVAARIGVPVDVVRERMAHRRFPCASIDDAISFVERGLRLAGSEHLRLTTETTEAAEARRRFYRAQTEAARSTVDRWLHSGHSEATDAARSFFARQRRGAPP